MGPATLNVPQRLFKIRMNFPSDGKVDKHTLNTALTSPSTLNTSTNGGVVLHSLCLTTDNCHDPAGEAALYTLPWPRPLAMVLVQDFHLKFV